MKEFTVIENLGVHAFHQDLNVRRPDNTELKTVVGRSMPVFKAGDKIKIYESNSKYLPIELARSYKLNGRRYIDLQMQPRTDSGIAKIYKDLSFFDAVRLNWDIVQALCQRRIMPTLSKYTNMRLFLAELPMWDKTH